MTGTIEWIEDVPTPTVGTIYKITIRNGYITLKALDKPYKISAAIKDLEKLVD